MNSNETAVRNAYQVAERKDLAGWVNCFTEDGTFTDESIGVIWRKRGDASTNVLAAAILGAVYWVTQGLANFYPGVAWTDPEFLKAGQTLNDIDANDPRPYHLGSRSPRLVPRA
jgi:hypothetical protein